MTTHASGQSIAWLPSKHEPPLLDGPLNHKYIKEHKANDWFLTLHDAMPQKYEARMMAKMYLFLRQYMPDGLTGRWAHLRGNEVMRVLLSDREEQCVSRHKVTKKIYSSLGKLQVWMTKGPSWRIASEKSKIEAKKMKPRTAKRNKLEKAPLPLYSPERCLAFLVLAYPDRKYRDMFQRLQLGWMMNDPKALNVQDQGFWWGLDSRAVSSVFLPEKPLPANENTNCSLDYDVLFGASFPKCREDIKLYLPPEEWAEGLCLGTKDTDDGTVDDGAVDNVDVHVIDDTSSDPDADGEEGDDQSSLGLSFPTSPTGTTIGKNAFSGYDDDDDDCASTAASSVELSSALEGLPKPTSTWTELGIVRHLSADDESDGALPGWVAHLLGQTHDTFTVMRTWCSFWQKRMSAAKTAEDQLLTRSLILQSARIIRSFRTSSAIAAADAYMLLDMGAWDELSGDCPEPRSNLTRIPQFAAYCKAKNRFVQLLGSANEDAATLCGKIFSRQAEYFYSAQTDPKLFRYAKDCMRLAEIRLRILSRRFVTGKTPALVQHGRLWDTAVLSALQVSHWQALAAMQPAADLRSILAGYQLQIYNEKYQAEGRTVLINDALRKPVLSLQSYTGDCQKEDRDILTALFGALEPQAQNQPALALGPVSNVTLLAKDLGQPDSLSREPEKDTQHQPITASQELEARSQTQPQPPQTPGSSTKSNNSKKRFSALHLRQDANPYAPQNPKRGVSKNERSAKGFPLGDKLRSTASSVGNDRNPYTGATESSTARPSRVASRESVLREEVRSLKEKVDLFLESQGRIREETTQIIEEKLDSITQAIISTVEGRLDSLSTQHTKTHKELVQVNQKVITTINEQSLKRKEVDETIVQKMESGFDDIKAMLSKVPSVGQEGYLARHCPAPGTMAPVAYEHALVRAAIYYFSLFTDADNSLVKDYGAMEETMERYPELVPGHIDKAIEHLHHIAYGHSMDER